MCRLQELPAEEIGFLAEYPSLPCFPYSIPYYFYCTLPFSPFTMVSASPWSVRLLCVPSIKRSQRAPFREVHLQSSLLIPFFQLLPPSPLFSSRPGLTDFLGPSFACKKLPAPHSLNVLNRVSSPLSNIDLFFLLLTLIISTRDFASSSQLPSDYGNLSQFGMHIVLVLPSPCSVLKNHFPWGFRFSFPEPRFLSAFFLL